MDLLKVSNDIEEALKKEELVGQRLGSGFCLLDNSRDVQFEYASQEVKDYFSKIEKVINEFMAKYKEYEVILRFKSDNFSFYVKPLTIEEKESVLEDSDIDCK